MLARDLIEHICVELLNFTIQRCKDCAVAVVVNIIISPLSLPESKEKYISLGFVLIKWCHKLELSEMVMYNLLDHGVYSFNKWCSSMFFIPLLNYHTFGTLDISSGLTTKTILAKGQQLVSKSETSKFCIFLRRYVLSAHIDRQMEYLNVLPNVWFPDWCHDNLRPRSLWNNPQELAKIIAHNDNKTTEWMVVVKDISESLIKGFKCHLVHHWCFIP